MTGKKLELIIPDKPDLRGKELQGISAQNVYGFNEYIYML
jgi:hypothetical protein